jgi:PAS domain S-box-containing protein
MTRILIVDDKEENLYLLRVLLEGHGYEVELAANGSEALDKARAGKQDMIISDILMPVMDGFTLCRTLKADGRLKHIPLVFYTATYTDSRDEKLALDMGANAFIVKPADPDEFMRRIEEILAANKDGKLNASQRQTAEDEIILKEYNEVLINKIEQKMLSLEKANKELEAEIATRKQAESQREASLEVLREKELQYRNLADSGLALIWTSGTDKLCNYFNASWLKFTGRTLEQEMGNGWIKGVHPDDFDDCLNTYVTAFDKRQAFDMEYRLRNARGEYRWIRDLGTPNYSSSGEFIGYIGHCFDITMQREAETEIRKLNKYLEQQIDERTDELKRKIVQLEELNRVFVNRELKMMELKERIAELEKQKT